MLKPVISLIYISFCCITFGCSNDYSKNISELELSIKSFGVSVHRLTSMDDVPVDNISYVNRGLIEAVPVKGTLIKITDQRYYDFLGLLKSELGKYPDNILRTDSTSGLWVSQ